MQDIINVSLLLEHMEWADVEVWQTVLNHQLVKDDAKIRKLLYHNHTVQRAFFYIWKNMPLEFPKETDFKELTDLVNWAKEYHDQVKDFINSFDENKLATILEIPWANQLEKVIGRKPESPTIEETMLQVALHTAYHRGQINTRLRELGGEPRLVDFIAWIWYGKPAADWNFVAG